MQADITADHDSGGRFKPGNKAGRKKGRRAQLDTASAYQRSLLAKCGTKDIEKIISALVIEATTGNNVQAAREVFDRVLGRVGDRPLQLVLLELREFDMPPLKEPSDLPVATQALAQAVALNKIDERRATKLAALVEQQRRNLESVTLQERVEALEQLIQSRALPGEGARLRIALEHGEGEQHVTEDTFEPVGT